MEKGQVKVTSAANKRNPYIPTLNSEFLSLTVMSSNKSSVDFRSFFGRASFSFTRVETNLGEKIERLWARVELKDQFYEMT